MTKRNCTVQHKIDQAIYEVCLIEGGEVVHRKEYHDYKLAQCAKEAWLSGEGPSFLAG